jgi:hypothetical protein
MEKVQKCEVQEQSYVPSPESFKQDYTVLQPRPPSPECSLLWKPLNVIWP